MKKILKILGVIAGTGLVSAIVWAHVPTKITHADNADSDQYADWSVSNNPNLLDLDAQEVSNNIPSTFNPGQTLTIGTDGKPLEITVENEGRMPWYDDRWAYNAGNPTNYWSDMFTLEHSTDSSVYGKFSNGSDAFGVGDDPTQYNNTNADTSECGQNPFGAGIAGYEAQSGSDTNLDTNPYHYSDQSTITSELISQGLDNSDIEDYVNDYFNNGGGGIVPFDIADTLIGTCPGGSGLYDNGNSAAVYPGKTITFPLGSLTAPTTPGTYTEAWNMIFNPPSTLATWGAGDPYGGGPAVSVPLYAYLQDFDLDLPYLEGFGMNGYGSNYNYSPNTPFGYAMPVTILVGPNVTGVNVTCTPSTITTTQTSQCSASVYGTNGTPGQAVTWSATKGSISPSGVFTPSTTGVATIFATSVQDPSVSGKASVTITSPAPTITSVTVNCAPSTITTAQNSQCAATVNGTGAYNSAVTWSSNIGSISPSGVFTSSLTGIATITATSVQDPSKSGSAAVNVGSVPSTITSVTVIANPTSITTTQTSQCSVTVNGTGAFTNAVNWSATDGTIDSSGVFTPSGTGTGSCKAVSVQDPSKSGSATITINLPPPTITSVTVTANPPSTQVGAPTQCSATVNGTGNFNSNVTWTATDGTIDSTGLLTPSSAGTATCTATSIEDPGKSGSASVPVSSIPVGTITVQSVNSVLQNFPVPATWNFPAYPNTDPCTVGLCDNLSNATYNNMPAGSFDIYTFNPLEANIPGFTLGSVKEVPIALHSSQSLSTELLSFAKNMLVSSAEAWTYPPSNPLVQTLTPDATINFIVEWDPNAGMVLSPTSLPLSATAGGSPTNGSVSITNIGAPGSTLTWTTTSNSPWLSASPTADSSGLTNSNSGNSSESVTITADPSSLSQGTYMGTITFNGVSAADGGTSSQTLTVTFDVGPAAGGGPTTSGFNCVSNACVVVASGAQYPDPGGAASCAAACTPPPPPACGSDPSIPCGTCTFSANPTTLIIPEKSKLNYSCSNVSSCSITGGNTSVNLSPAGNSTVISGTTAVSPTANTTYTLTCSGSNGGTVTQTTQVNLQNLILCESNPGGTNCPKQ
jgi:hypothetical protein